VKARKVKGLDPDGPLGDQLERIVRVRTEELFAFMPRAADPDEITDLHDMRIAAKRLRYILEIAEESFGPYAATAAKRVKELQDLLGEIHDCDVTLPRVLDLAERARQDDVELVRMRAGDAKDLQPRLASGGPNAQAYRGLAALATYYQARRELLFDRFVDFWESLQREGFRSRLEYAAAERQPSSSEPSHDGNGAGQERAAPSPATP
jgi:CHAD domain-containing protein